MAALPLLLLLVTGAADSGLPDRGIFPDLDRRASISIPPTLSLRAPWLRLDARHGVATLYDGPHAIKAWPAALAASPRSASRLDELRLREGDPAARVAPGEDSTVVLRAADLAELRERVATSAPVVVGAPSAAEDHDGDGVVDRLDVLLGARKLVANRARYEEHYRTLPYPGGDVPRSEGVCTDTIVRAFRNAGIDLQKEIHEDIARAPRSYPTVEKPNASIDHRRVRVMLPWLRRHLVEIPAGERLLPGDVVLFDTFPRKSGPDHIGIVSDHEQGGVPLVVNNWTDGSVEGEMELLSWVPVTHRFRVRTPPAPAPPVPAR